MHHLYYIRLYQWKTAFVLPLFKSGDKQRTSNYKPIALLSTTGNVFERVIFKHIFNHFLDNNLLGFFCFFFQFSVWFYNQPFHHLSVCRDIITEFVLIVINCRERALNNCCHNLCPIPFANILSK